MDKMVLTLKSTKPDFVNKYFDARKIIDLGTATGKIRGTVTNQDKKPLTGAILILRLTGQTTTVSQTKSDAQGNFSIANIKPGNYDFECSLSKFNTISETNIKFSPGKELKRKIILTSTIAPATPAS